MENAKRKRFKVKKYKKKVLAIVLAVSCVVGVSFAVNAAYTTNVSFQGNNSIGYSSESVKPGQKKKKVKITYVSFNGLVDGAWPVGKYVRTALFSTSTPHVQKSTHCSFTHLNESGNVSMNDSANVNSYYKAGAWSDYYNGATVVLKWTNP